MSWESRKMTENDYFARISYGNVYKSVFEYIKRAPKNADFCMTFRCEILRISGKQMPQNICKNMKKYIEKNAKHIEKYTKNT